MVISQEGRDYREKVVEIVRVLQVEAMTGRLQLDIYLYPPDFRRRDLDNVFKSVLDSLAHGGAYLDDSQIDKLSIVRCLVCAPGSAIVEMKELECQSIALTKKQSTTLRPRVNALKDLRLTA
jgi:crossover junction endodeoxyribonuclease RusA